MGRKRKRRKKLSRWELAAPFDALSWALCLKNRRAARALLEKREALTWVQGSGYAPLTLGWAPDLLAMILDRLPEGEEELFCLRSFSRPGDGRNLLVESSLLTAAAALDDLEAVELLLARGNCELNEHELYRRIHFSPHFHELGRIQGNMNPIFITKVLILRRPEGEKEDLWYASLDTAGPLSAAILCGAGRCALRLLEEGAELTLSVRNSLCNTAMLEDERYRAAVEAVTSALGTELPDLLDPSEFLDRRHPLFPECVRRRGKALDPGLIHCLLTQESERPWARECLRLADPLLLSGCLLDILRDDASPSCRASSRDVKWAFYDPGLELVLDRNAVSPRVNIDALLLYLDHARVVGDVPEGELSGLAVRLLDDMMNRSFLGSARGRGGRTSPVTTRHLSILLEEDPGLIWKYLDEKGYGRDPGLRVALVLLGIQEEVRYEL